MFIAPACRILALGAATLWIAMGLMPVASWAESTVTQSQRFAVARVEVPAPVRVGAGDRIASSLLSEANLSAGGGSDRVDSVSESSDRASSELNHGPLDFLHGGPENWTSPEGLSGSLQSMLLLAVLSLAPAVLLMTTCYVRIIVVLGLLRQAIGLQSLPPTQVMTSVALFMTLFVMTPVWTRVYDDAVAPYTDPEIDMSLVDAYEAGSIPVREFMSRQIDTAGNHDDVHLFYSYMDADAPLPSTFSDVPMRVLLPAFILSELKTAFLMGFQIYLPFLIVDLVVASVTISMGMLMLPPAVISLPFKLLLFVLVDGWRLVVEMLMNSFGTF
ncbi:flagellar type III secretion system pore protein FliP [Allorhodopirellula solitaria]|uniref:Flagellar biosynthetic protein FliP n=1 Tax=Allorhodopirellula solitaria TaxID=2527987 RepID=A0A5C5XVU8_9BACT|nr:flagellar type III secretion system pore protein FliP [Allorhodopirellula solitaria]TWT66523.1 Flagellar biosynthetic protein FliP precursor [Allorhodopirellula solitaria]